MRAVLVLAGLLLVAGIAALLALPWAARTTLDRALAANGLSPAGYTALDVGLGGARLEALAIGDAPDLEIASVEVAFGPLDLLRRRVRQIDVRGLRVRGRQEEGSWSFGALDTLMTGGEGGAPPLRAFALTLEDSEVSLDTAYGALRIPIAGRLALDGERIDGEMRFAAEHETGRIEGTLRVEPAAEGGGVAAVTLAGEAPSLTGDIELRWRGPADARELAGRASVALRDLRLPIPTDADADAVAADIARFELEAELSGPVRALAGSTTLSFAGSGSLAGFAAEGLGLEARLRWRAGDDGQSVHLEECARVAVRALTGAGLALLEPVSLCVEAAEAPLWSAPAADDGAPPALAATLPPTALRLRVGSGEEPLEIAGTTPRIDLHHRLAAGETPAQSELATRGGALHLPTFGVRAEGLSFQAQLEDGVLAGVHPFSVARVVDDTTPPRLPVLEIAGTLRPEREAIGLRAEARGAEATFRADVEGRHDPASGNGHATVTFAPLAFTPGGLAPGDVLPALSEWVAEAEGEARVRGVLRWGEQPGSEGVVILRDLRIESPLAEIELLNAALHLDSLLPPSTPRNQLVAMARLHMGLVLADGLIDFQLRPDGVIDLASAEWSLAGGRIFAAGELDPAAEEPSLVLEVEDLALERLLEVLEVDGLAGEGIVDGSIPVSLRDDSAWIDAGRLVARKPGGVLRYRPAGQAPIENTPTGGIELARKALENFEYHTLEITLDGDAGGDLALRLHLAGANPALYDGYPIELNVNVTGAFGELVNQGLAGYRVPDVIQQRLSAFGADAP